MGSKGGVLAFGDATWYGSASKLHLHRPVVGMASTPDGGGYWLVSSDGGVFAYGDAGYYGSAGHFHIRSSIVDVYKRQVVCSPSVTPVSTAAKRPAKRRRP